MPHISWRHDRQRLILPVAILPSLTEQSAQRSEVVWGILDTGATSTGIRQDVVERLGLLKRGRRRVFTANGDMIATEHFFRMGFYPGDFRDSPPDPERSLPHVLADELLGYALHPNFSVPVIIGMDVIGLSDLHLGRDGSVSFELP
ncbi:MAG: aspartyl protease family protein [Sphingomonadaceae bacterium]|nr:aspartyl protease family protein [Sphingomonadaceae bacterium]